MKHQSASTRRLTGFAVHGAAWVGALVMAAGLLSGCSNKTCTGFEAPARSTDHVQLIADFGPNQVTGVAVSSTGRVFVNFPDWRGLSGVQSAMAVAEVMPDGTMRPYPNTEWNGVAESTSLMSGVTGSEWTDAQAVADSTPTDSLSDEDPDKPDPGILPGDRFVSVQSVYVDGRDRLWILDTANPSFAGVQYAGGGPKLIEVDLRTDSVARVIRFDPNTAPFDSYLNDVRIDTAEAVAFISDSGLGAIVVVDLVSHKARRVLTEDPSTQADPTLIPMIGGTAWRSADTGGVPQIQSDGLAFDEKNKILYWQALTGDRLYAIDSRILSSRTVPEWQIANSVRELGTTCVSDGMCCDAFGDVYFTSLELNAVTRLNGSNLRRALRSGTKRDWRSNLQIMGQDARLGWPDSLAIGPIGPTGPGGTRQPGGQWLYVTTSQIHRLPAFGGSATAPIDPVSGSMGYGVFRIKLP